MLASITPLGERGRLRRWGPTAAAYTCASALGGALLGALVGLAGWGLAGASAPARAAVFAVAVATGLVLDARHRLPTVHRQVDEAWLTVYRGWVCGLGYGGQLGFAVVTIVPSAATYLAFLLALLAGSPLVGTAIGAAFGAARALPVLAVRRVDDAPTLRELHRRLDGWARPVATATVSAQCLAAVAVLALGALR